MWIWRFWLYFDGHSNVNILLIVGYLFILHTWVSHNGNADTNNVLCYKYDAQWGWKRERERAAQKNDSKEWKEAGNRDDNLKYSFQYEWKVGSIRCDVGASMNRRNFSVALRVWEMKWKGYLKGTKCFNVLEIELKVTRAKEENLYVRPSLWPPEFPLPLRCFNVTLLLFEPDGGDTFEKRL